MAYKTIVVHVNESHHGAERIQLASAIAVQHGAHLIGLATTPMPQFFYMAGIDAAASGALSTYLTFMKEGALTALAAFEGFAEQAGVATFEQRLVEDDTATALCLQGRYADLLVIGQSDPDEALAAQDSDMPDIVLTHASCPILIVPFAGRFDTVGQRVVVAWNGSVEAARAIAASLPMLGGASVVQAVVFNVDSDPLLHSEQPGADLAAFLARHDVKVDVTQQSVGEGLDIGDALLSFLSDFNADLLIMGGFGHSRLREMVLGGVTRTMLESMTVPVLMAH